MVPSSSSCISITLVNKHKKTDEALQLKRAILYRFLAELLTEQKRLLYLQLDKNISRHYKGLKIKKVALAGPRRPTRPELILVSVS